MDPTYPLVPIVNFLSCILVLLPLLVSAFRRGPWNIGVTVFSFWTATECIITGVNAIIWSNNVADTAPIWCDIGGYLLKLPYNSR